MEVWLLNTLLSSTEAGDNVSPANSEKNNSVHCNIQVIFYATVLYLRLGGRSNLQNLSGENETTSI